MKKTLLSLATALLSLSALAGHYQNFRAYFHDTPVEVQCIVRNTHSITDLMNHESLKGEIRKSEKVVDRPITDVEVITVKLAPHSFRAFKINR